MDLPHPTAAPELPSMVATLCSYEGRFGPYHPQTLRLTAEVGMACWRHGELAQARCLLNRAIRDLGRFLGRDHDTRMRAIAALRDLPLQQREYEQAGVLQKEFVECQAQRLGAEHPDTLASRSRLAAILWEAAQTVS